LELDPIDPSREGMADYCGALLTDVGLGAFSHSALVRIADEVCLQMHLLNLSSGSRCVRAPEPTPSTPGRSAPNSSSLWQARPPSGSGTRFTGRRCCGRPAPH
jgi:hypothetical protein